MNSENIDCGVYFITKDNFKIWYRFFKGRKPTLVFLHGLTGSSSAWEQIYPYFIKRGHSVLLIDYRGHGLSDKPKEKNKYSFKKIAEDLKYLLDYLKMSKIILIGHCYGGLLSQQFYQVYPKYVKKIVLISTNYQISKNKFQYIINHIPYCFYSILSILLYPLHFEKNKVHEDYRKFNNTHDLSLKRLSTDIKVTSFRTFLPLYKEAISLDFTDVLKKSHIPVLIIHGKKDMFFPMKRAEEMHSLIKKSDLHIINSNHITILANAKEVTDLINNFI